MTPLMMAIQVGDYELAWKLTNGASRDMLLESLGGQHRMVGYSVGLSWACSRAQRSVATLCGPSHHGNRDLGLVCNPPPKTRTSPGMGGVFLIAIKNAWETPRSIRTYPESYQVGGSLKQVADAPPLSKQHLDNIVPEIACAAWVCVRQNAYVRTVRGVGEGVICGRYVPVRGLSVDILAQSVCH